MSRTASFLPEDFGFCPENLTAEQLQAFEEYKARNASCQENWEHEGFVGSTVE